LITLDGALLRTTASRTPLDELALAMLARAGMIAEQVVEGVRRASDADGLDLDQSVLGGLLVRLMKLLSGVFQSVNADESEAHLILVRPALETAVTIAWLVDHRAGDSLRRFRADSFVFWRRWRERAEASDVDEDQAMRATRLRIEQKIDRELSAAGLTWEEIPKRMNSWGPGMRERCEQLGRGWLYSSFFSGHSSYVHPSWHELSALHLTRVGHLGRLDVTFAGIAPVAAYKLTRISVEACAAAARELPCDLDAEDLARRVADTVTASRMLSAHFADFMARGGLDDELGHEPA
jgi:hypothetical protein